VAFRNKASLEPVVMAGLGSKPFRTAPSPLILVTLQATPFLLLEAGLRRGSSSAMFAQFNLHTNELRSLRLRPAPQARSAKTQAREASSSGFSMMARMKVVVSS